MSDHILSQIRTDIAILVDVAFRGEPADLPGAHWSMIQETAPLIYEDLLALTERDAAAGHDPHYVYVTYASFRSVLAYRVAHALIRLDRRHRPGMRASDLAIAARFLSEVTKSQTGIEIHPAACIGRRFVIDHGHGTVIGEQVTMGDDCYVLQNVTLGGRYIADSSLRTERRHPAIGSRVQIGGGASIFGPVSVGDDCRLDAGVQITSDIPAGSHVRMVAAVQIVVADAHPEIFGVLITPQRISISGRGLDSLRPVLLDPDQVVLEYLTVVDSSDSLIDCAPPLATHNAALLGLLDQTRLLCSIRTRMPWRPQAANVLFGASP